MRRGGGGWRNVQDATERENMKKVEQHMEMAGLKYKKDIKNCGDLDTHHWARF